VYQLNSERTAIFSLVVHPSRLQLNRDAALPFQIHVVEKLLLHLPLIHRASSLQEAVCK